MFKNLISPIQAWLLSQGRCVGCGDILSHGKKDLRNGREIITCRCGRMFVHDSKKSLYRRALFNEV
jgi:hypothetical protein